MWVKSNKPDVYGMTQNNIQTPEIYNPKQYLTRWNQNPNRRHIPVFFYIGSNTLGFYYILHHQYEAMHKLDINIINAIDA